MAMDIRAWVYTTDQAKEYQLGVSNYIAIQGGATPAIGGRAEVGADQLDRLPSGFSPRVAKVHNAGNGKSRRVVCFSADAPLYVGTVSVISLQDGAGTSAVYTRNGASGERSRNRNVGV